MKFIFDRAKQSREDGFFYILKETFLGTGSFTRQGLEFNSPDDWLDYAQTIGRALGITDCECEVLSPTRNEKSFVFSFGNQKDLMAFQVAISGYNPGEHIKNISSLTAQDSIDLTHKLHSFCKTNEINANIMRSGEKDVRIITNNQLDYFTIIQALIAGKFDAKPTATSDPHSPQP